jgi:hypothetical protein
VNFPASPTTYLKKTGFLNGVGDFTQAIVSYWSKLSVCEDGMWNALELVGSTSFASITTSDGTYQYFAYDIAEGYYDTLPSDFPQPNRGPISTNWIHVLCSIDSDVLDAAVRTWRSGIEVTADFDTDPNFADTPMHNLSDMYFFTDQFSKIVGDVADLQMWVNAWLDFSIPANRELFIKNGLPVNPSIAAQVLGTPAVLFQGNTTNFIVNQGTGGAFTLIGSLTNSTSSPTPHTYNAAINEAGTGALSATGRMRMAVARTFAGAGNLSVNGSIV